MMMMLILPQLITVNSLSTKKQKYPIHGEPSEVNTQDYTGEEEPAYVGLLPSTQDSTGISAIRSNMENFLKYNSISSELLEVIPSENSKVTEETNLRNLS
jgi:hypothetical protein